MYKKHAWKRVKKSLRYLAMVCFTYFVTLALAYAGVVSAFPAHASLAGLSRDEVDRVLASLEQATPSPPPGPLSDSGTKLVNDDLHPYKAPGEDDIRGPCPALNALASHGVRIIFREIFFDLQFNCRSISIATVLLTLQRSSLRWWKVCLFRSTFPTRLIQLSIRL